MIHFLGRMTDRPEESYHLASCPTGFDVSNGHSLKQPRQRVRLL
jgi:hypothetical protein